MAERESYESTERLIPDEGKGDHGYVPPRANHNYRFWFTALNITLFTVTVLIVSIHWTHAKNTQSGYSNDMNHLLKQISYYSPMLDRLNIPLQTKSINNTLYARSIYAQPPSPEVDAAWRDLTRLGLTTISTEDVRRIGKDPSLTVHKPDDPDAHLVMPSINHQLHCLNGLRKNIFSDYYYPGGSKEPLHWDHLYHCLDLILQALQCNSNVDLITYNWMELVDIPQPDFTVNMMCRDWSALKAWQNEFQLDEYESVGAWTRQNSDKNVSVPWQWREIAKDEGIQE